MGLSAYYTGLLQGLNESMCSEVRTENRVWCTGKSTCTYCNKGYGFHVVMQNNPLLHANEKFFGGRVLQKDKNAHSHTLFFIAFESSAFPDCHKVHFQGPKDHKVGGRGSGVLKPQDRRQRPMGGEESRGVAPGVRGRSLQACWSPTTLTHAWTQPRPSNFLPVNRRPYSNAHTWGISVVSHCALQALGGKHNHQDFSNFPAIATWEERGQPGYLPGCEIFAGSNV